MDKRLAKRHKRQVARAKDRVRISEPDVRTPEQIAAAKEASRPDVNRGEKSSVRNSTGFRSSFSTGSAAKSDNG
jgi:hypothetical protein